MIAGCTYSSVKNRKRAIVKYIREKIRFNTEHYLDDSGDIDFIALAYDTAVYFSLDRNLQDWLVEEVFHHVEEYICSFNTFDC